MKEIIVDGPRHVEVKIGMVGGPKPYLGIWVDDRKHPAEKTWHPINDRDLWRLELAVVKCRRANEKS